MAMFGNNKEATNIAEISNSETRIGKGTFLKGDLETHGHVRVDGSVTGHIKSKSRVVLGDSSKIQGSLQAQNAEIAGEVKGKVEVIDILTLKASAVINGDIVCSKLIVESGAVLNGNTKMGTSFKEIVLSDFSKLQLANEKSKAHTSSEKTKSAATADKNKSIVTEEPVTANNTDEKATENLS